MLGMFVKIKSAKYDTLWYFHKIGEVIFANSFLNSENMYSVIEEYTNSDFIIPKYIFHSDIEIIRYCDYTILYSTKLKINDHI